MCFITIANSKIQVAVLDPIYVLKYGSQYKRSNKNVFVSTWYDYVYKQGESNPKIVLRIKDRDIEEGYHSFCDILSLTYDTDNSKEQIDEFIKYKLEDVGIFKIPKGSVYYRNSLEIVSDNIIYHRPARRKDFLDEDSGPNHRNLHFDSDKCKYLIK